MPKLPAGWRIRRSLFGKLILQRPCGWNSGPYDFSIIKWKDASYHDWLES